MGSWIADAQEHTVALLAAAAKRPDTETLRVLESVPDIGYGCAGSIEANVQAFIVSLRNNADPAAIAGALLDEYGHDGNIDDIGKHAKALTSLIRAHKAVTRTLPREEHDEIEDDIFLPADHHGWWEKAAQDIPHVFHEGLARKTLGVLSGQGGVSKTTFITEVGVSLAIGRALVPGLSPVNRGSVLMFFGEDSDHVAFRRLRAICDVLGVNPDEIDEAFDSGRLSLVCGQPEPFLHNMVPTKAYNQVLEQLQRQPRDLVVIDPFIAFAGIEDENSNTHMQRAAEALIHLARVSGGAVVAVHHSNKAGDRSADTSQTLTRGGSALACASRWGAILRPFTEDDCRDNGVSKERSGEFVSFHMTKNQYRPLNMRRRVFQREDCGVLVPFDNTSERDAGIIAAILDILNTDDPQLSRREMVRGTNKVSVAFRQAMERKLGYAPTQNALGAAIAAGVIDGDLLETNGPKVGRGPAKQVIARNPAKTPREETQRNPANETRAAI